MKIRPEFEKEKLEFKKLRGRPKRDPHPGERFTIATRVTPELKLRLDAAAAASGRSQAQESELRLERSFDKTDLLPQVLTLAYGVEIASVLMELGNFMYLRKLRAAMAAMGSMGRATIPAIPREQMEVWLNEFRRRSDRRSRKEE